MIRELRDDDVEAYVALRREALQESPLAFASSPRDDRFSSPEAVREQLGRAPEAVLLGAFQGLLVGAVGLYRDRHVKASHKVHLWGMYVTPSQRGRGLASQLLAAALRHAEALPGVTWVQLAVSSAAPAAQRLYERAGFQAWGTEPAALCHEGRTLVEVHMALRLPAAR
jgi:ribosomal protein S18 acetylase RimI-like enzyme